MGLEIPHSSLTQILPKAISKLYFSTLVDDKSTGSDLKKENMKRT